MVDEWHHVAWRYKEGMLEIFVAFLQAFIFTFLTTRFIGMSIEVHDDSHHEEAAV